MTPDDRETLAQMRQLQERTERTLAEIRGMRAHPPPVVNNSNHQTSGERGIWIAATCCAVQLTATFFLTLVVYWVAMNDRDKGHQMNAVYQSVPGLRELVEKQTRLNKSISQPQETDRK